MNYLICYDIVENKKRTHFAKMLDGFGDRVQKSVFELPKLDKDTFEACLRKIKSFELDEDDSVRIYPLCEACRKAIKIFGAGVAMEVPDVYIV